MAIGMPGWPLLAFCTASIESVRMVSMDRRSMSTFAGAVVLIACKLPLIARRYRPGHGPPRLPLDLEVPRLGGPAARPPRRGRRAARGVRPRRADVVVLVAQGHPAGARRGLSLHRARPSRLRALRQARRHRLVHLRSSHGGADRAG